MLRRKPKRRQRRAARSRPIRLEKLEQRHLLAATGLGVTPMDTGEFLLGKVAVTPVFFESNGKIDPESQNWTTEEIDQVLAKVSEGVNWWSDTLDTLDTVHTLEFVIDDTYARAPVQTPYEPIDRSSSVFNKYVGEFMTSLGFGDANSIEDAVRRFNHGQRAKLEADWAFTIFVVDSSDDPDGLFASGGSFAAAFAFAGGLFIVTPSTRPASTIAHEMGHIFWARDEYSGGGSWTDRRGYYDAQNLNAWDNPTPGFQQQISILRGGVPLTAAFEAHVSPESTFAMVGWRDSDGDGVFDLADVPLSLDASGYFDADNSTYHFAGVASAVPLINRNSSGPQSDITLNRISQLQYRLDDGPWLVAAQFDQQVVELDISLTIEQPFSTIRWRVTDQSTGVASAEVEGTMTIPALPQASLSGVAFVDENSDGDRNPAEPALAATQVIIRNGDGSPLFSGEVNAVEFPDGGLPENSPGVTLVADGIVLDSQVGSFVSAAAGQQRVFHAFDQQREKWIERWSSKAALEASFDQAVGEVQLTAIGFNEPGFARMEAYDAAGQLLHRATSQAIGIGEQATLRVTDSLGRIASIRAFGHAGTSVALNDLRFGSEDRIITGPSGAWRIQNLPDGDYIVELAPERLIHQFTQPALEISVNAGASELIVAAASRVHSPRHNALLPEDANQDGIISSRDALVIINDLNRFAPRVLQASELTGFDIDVSNDGLVSARDALLVINYLSRQDRASGEFEEIDAFGLVETSQMFNSAGGTIPDESTERQNADTTDQPLVAPLPMATKIEEFRPISGPKTSTTEGQEPENAVEPGRWIIPITTEISEPFEHFEI